MMYVDIRAQLFKRISHTKMATKLFSLDSPIQGENCKKKKLLKTWSLSYDGPIQPER